MIAPTKPIHLALVDDHMLLRSSLAKSINDFDNCKVVIQASDGMDLIEQMQQGVVPDIVIMDLGMPRMNGMETSNWLRKEYPKVAVLILTMYDSDMTMVRLMNTGVAGILKKDIHHSELLFAIQSVVDTGFYYSKQITGKLVNLIRKNDEGEMNLERVQLTDQEMDFLRLACTDKTYKEIASEINLNIRTVDTIRDHLFNKLGVRSRVGMAMYAVRQGIVPL